MSIEYLEIPKCPKCSDGHRYKLKVERSMVVKMMTMADFNEPERKVRVTRIFTCPTNSEEFQARFVLTDTSSGRIENVSVVGLADGNE